MLKEFAITLSCLLLSSNAAYAEWIDPDAPADEPPTVDEPAAFDPEAFNTGNFEFSTTSLNVIATPETRTSAYGAPEETSAAAAMVYDAEPTTETSFAYTSVLDPDDDDVEQLLDEGVNANGASSTNTPLTVNNFEGVASMDADTYSGMGGGTEIIDQFN